MLFIDNPTVEKVLTMEDCIDAIEEAFKGLLTRESVHRTRIDIYVPCDRDDGYFRWGTMEGASKTLGVHAIRMKSDIVHWPKDEQGNWTEEKYCMEPGTFCGLIFLVSTRNGEPLALHQRRNSAAHLAWRYGRARRQVSFAARFESRGHARIWRHGANLLKAFCTVRPIEKVRVYSPTKANREAYADEMSEALGLEIQVVDNPQEAVRGADIVSAATDAMTPVVLGEWLEPGMHVTNLGNYELDDASVRSRRHRDQGWALGTDSERSCSAYRDRAQGTVRWPISRERMRKSNRLPPARANAQHFDQGAFPFVHGSRQRQAIPAVLARADTVYLNGGNQGLQFAAASCDHLSACEGAGPRSSTPHRVVPAGHPRLNGTIRRLPRKSAEAD